MSPRIDILGSRLLGKPLTKLFPTRRRKVPILMYHSIGSVPEVSSNHPYYLINTSTERFRAQLQFLSDNGYKSILPETIFDPNTTLNGNEVVITFDDGYQDNFSRALPILEEFSFTAVIYIPVGFIAKSNNRFKLNGVECMNWNEVRQAHKRGIRIGSHTVDHARLVQLTENERSEQLTASKAILEDKLGEEITDFAFPYAFPETKTDFVKQLKDELVQAGYSNNVTTIIGRVTAEDDPFLLKRLPINDLDDTNLMRIKLEGSYDWMRSAQYLAKICKRTFARA